jgi:hypothetical protein
VEERNGQSRHHLYAARQEDEKDIARNQCCERPDEKRMVRQLFHKRPVALPAIT